MVKSKKEEKSEDVISEDERNIAEKRLILTGTKEDIEAAKSVLISHKVNIKIKEE